MWALGEAMLPGLGLHSEGRAPRSPSASPVQAAGAHASGDASAALAEMVTQGMLVRDQHRVECGSGDDRRGAQLLLPRKLSGARARPVPPAGPALAPAHRGSAQGASPGAIRRSNSWEVMAGRASSGEKRHTGGNASNASNASNAGSAYDAPKHNTRILSATRPDGSARSREAPLALSASPRDVLDSQMPGRSGSASRVRVAGTDGALASSKLLPAKTGRGVRGQGVACSAVTCSADGLPLAHSTPTGKGFAAAAEATRNLRLPAR